MLNPFEEEPSQQEELSPEPALPCSLQPQTSPILALQQHWLLNEQEPDQRVHQLLKELKNYSEGLEKRNLDLAWELEKEKTRNKQLESALGMLVGAGQERMKSLEEQLGRAAENRSRLEVEVARREMVESEVKGLRLENSYLKDLILVANDNYQKLEDRNRQLIESIDQLEQQLQQKDADMFRRTEELRGMLAGFADKGERR